MQPSPKVSPAASPGYSLSLSSADQFYDYILEKARVRPTLEILAISHKDIATPALEPAKELRAALDRLLAEDRILSFGYAVNGCLLVQVTKDDHCSAHPSLQVNTPWYSKQIPAPQTPATPLAPPSLYFTQAQCSLLGQIREKLCNVDRVIKLDRSDFGHYLENSLSPAGDLLKCIRQLVYRELLINSFARSPDGQTLFICCHPDHKMDGEIQHLLSGQQVNWHSAQYPEPGLSPEEGPLSSPIAMAEDNPHAPPP
jgi:hypothetical protein